MRPGESWTAFLARVIREAGELGATLSIEGAAGAESFARFHLPAGSELPRGAIAPGAWAGHMTMAPGPWGLNGPAYLLGCDNARELRARLAAELDR